MEAWWSRLALQAERPVFAAGTAAFPDAVEFLAQLPCPAAGVERGFAVETVTEDAHTALKFQRLGWKSAFLDIPLAAGLATERLVVHVIQRTRWARGMTQIFRVDNPLFGRGLTFQQRLCYLSAMLYYQFALPRVVFVTAPLAYLLFNLNIIYSSASLIVSYALPHLFLAIYVGSRMNGRYRYSFWGEIYDIVLAFTWCCRLW